MLPIVSVKRGPDEARLHGAGPAAGARRADRPADRIAGGRARLHRGAGSARGGPVPAVLPEHHARRRRSCILCGGCVDICPEHCIRIVPAEDIEGLERRALERARDPGGPLHPLRLCVDRCPTDALSLEGWSEASTAPIALDPVREVTRRRRTAAGPGPEWYRSLFHPGELFRESEVCRSAIRHPRPNTPRGRAMTSFQNFFLHIYPVKVPRRSRGPGRRCGSGSSRRCCTGSCSSRACT